MTVPIELTAPPPPNTSPQVRAGVDACFVPSDAVRDIAIRRGVDPSRIFQYGLPVREPFWRVSERGARPSAKQLNKLGLAPGKRTVIVTRGFAYA